MLPTPAVFVGQNGLDRLRQVKDIATDSCLISEAVLGDRPPAFVAA